MRRVLSSTDEIFMLEEIESLYEPTSYSWEPGTHVDYITPEVCRHIQLIYLDKGLGNDAGTDGGDDNETSRQKTSEDSDAVGGGEPKPKRLKT